MRDFATEILQFVIFTFRVGGGPMDAKLLAWLSKPEQHDIQLRTGAESLRPVYLAIGAAVLG